MNGWDKTNESECVKWCIFLVSTELETESSYGDVDSGNSTNHSPNEDKNISQATEGKTFFIALVLPSFD